ncbi:unnamed protein product [Rotaria sordida]|uniref:alpha-L-rhamnosidase n=1 Tax=Rotaria sordida TaxID=392033 RepID=A0A819LDU4_9BILA|nr:unnamed protein product [Rotaria sordida]
MYDARNVRPDWARVGFNDSLSAWIMPELMPPPLNITLNGQLILQDMLPIRSGLDALHFETSQENGYLKTDDIGEIKGAPLTDRGSGVLKPVAMWQPTTGQNMAGWCRVKLRGARGVGVYIRHSEILAQPLMSTGQSYGGINTESLRSAAQIDIYVLRGDPAGEIYEPTSQRDERTGWTGDTALSVDEALYNFDLMKFYLNYLNLIIDLQLANGAIPDVAPGGGGYPADPNWGTALPTITWQLYRHYNDSQILADYYNPVRAYVENIRSGYNNTGLVNLAYQFGDWVPPPPYPQTNAHLIASTENDCIQFSTDPLRKDFMEPALDTLAAGGTRCGGNRRERRGACRQLRLQTT